ncbi:MULTISPECIES: nickel pincer cofactor biosynthesis protein LarC [Coprobacillaceae]|uniref:nickel pincer cofactor biosynthesis protein LarC n=1 Tax=Coprobacillaceae TaxID=2810280 RepID=UPI000E5438A0|nr:MULTISPECIES: nickel pincer cofactor biosynthesis protein LarC [Coprobacillaceae]RHM61710.1 nickel pincer cofactor biosynthesis protein LarC [Coprobacillus sp. AF33-1AC]RHS91726.1 nickel pincer cofactor biosynthesis protein LarC [Erysipelatoclostridium sp. AM42-17]
MKALYFDCQSGISGNMTLGALLEITKDENYLRQELDKLHVDGYYITINKTVKNGISGTYVDVILENHEHHHDHHHHEHRNLHDINHIIDQSELDEKVKDLAKRIFLRVAKAESKVHQKSLDEIHFHEVGAIDSIVDIVGCAILIQQINPDVIYSSVVHDGYGYVECAHGTIPVPVPATSEIFTDPKVKMKQVDIEGEMVTPTGAAIISELAESFGTMPTMNVSQIGWGCGTKDFKIPNVLKVSLGETEAQNEDVIVLECNIDDISGEVLGYTMECLFEHGALDVFYTPIYMKKNRPAYRLSVILKENDLKEIQNIIFKETSTIGVRYRHESRTILKRELSTIETPYGLLKVKKVYNDHQEYIYPEYESAKQLAKDHHLALKDIYHLVK